MSTFEGNWNEFVEKMVHQIGQNYGYSNEISTKEQVPQEVVDEMYRGLWKHYAIDNVHIISFYCETCVGYHKETPFHFDANTLLNVKDEKVLLSLNRNAWTDENIQEVETELNTIQNAIQGINPDAFAKEKRKAYGVIVELSRIANEVSSAKGMKIQKEFYESIRALPYEDVQKRFDEYTSLYQVENGLDRLYKLY